MLRLTYTCLLIFGAFFFKACDGACPLRPNSVLSNAARTPGDGGYRIITSGTDQKYTPNVIYAISIRGKLIIFI